MIKRRNEREVYRQMLEKFRNASPAIRELMKFEVLKMKSCGNSARELLKDFEKIERGEK